MSRIACVWADLGKDAAAADQWYEDTHISVVGQLAVDNMFKEVAGIEGTHMTVYDLPSGKHVNDLDAPLDMSIPDARIDAHIYTEYASWHGQEWRGDAHDIQMWIVVLWQPKEAVHDQFVEWFRDEFAPGMLESHELLRTRIFKLDSASLKKQQQGTKSMYQYLTFWEFDVDELPWDILVYLGSSERWRYYVEGGQLQWQIGQYLVDRAYPEQEEGQAIRFEDDDNLASGSSKDKDDENNKDTWKSEGVTLGEISR